MWLFNKTFQEKILKSLQYAIWKSIRVFLPWWGYLTINHLEDVSLSWNIFVLIDCEWNTYHINWTNFIWFFEPRSNAFSFRKKEDIN